MLPGDRLICAFVYQVPVGRQFTRWLLHITIVPWFRLDETPEQLSEGIRRALTTIKPFEALAGEIVMFGPQKNRPARLIEPTQSLKEIERKTRNYLHKKRAWLVDETTKKQHLFRPHVTVQGKSGLNAHQNFEVNKLYIVEQKGNYKKIVAEITLG